ncbi:glycosyltransferase [bacterium]|nr:glycosyltransferase [bacterium]
MAQKRTEIIKMPKVTVITPVYNGEKYLDEAIQSILNQTFSDFEYIVINDCSTDKTGEILKKYLKEDARVKLLQNETNKGVCFSLNRGLREAKGEYVAIMDSDDISLPQRLEKQVSFMDSHPEIGVCGSWLEFFGNKIYVWKTIPQHNDIFVGLLFGSMFGHPTVIMRKSVLLDLKALYSEEHRAAGDYNFWVRLGICCVRFANIQEVLLNYRFHSANISTTKRNLQKENAQNSLIILLKKLGVEPTTEELRLHSLLKKGIAVSRSEVKDVSLWLNKLVEANKNSKLCSESALSILLAKRWFSLCYRSSRRVPLIFTIYFSNKISKSIRISPKQKVKFFIKSILP